MKRLFVFLFLGIILIPNKLVDAQANIALNKTYVTIPKKSSCVLKIKGIKRKIKWSL